MTEEEKMRWFLLRASTIVGERVQHFDDILEDKFFIALESLFFEKEDVPAWPLRGLRPSAASRPKAAVF